MRLRNILMLFILSFTFVSVTQGQNQRGGGFDIEAIKKEKAEFLKKEMDLTEAEVKNFIPMEQELMSKKFEINRNAHRLTRELRKKENKTDADYKKITQINLDAETKEAALQKEYFQKFATVLSAEKIERYRHADQKYMQKLLERRKNK